MDNTTVFITGIGTTMLASALVILYLRSRLTSILADLCGTAERARFWTSFTNLAILLVPVLFSMHYQPKKDSVSVFFEVAAQFRWGLIGLVLTVVSAALFIRGTIAKGSGEKGAGDKAHT